MHNEWNSMNFKLTSFKENYVMELDSCTMWKLLSNSLIQPLKKKSAFCIISSMSLLIQFRSGQSPTDPMGHGHCGNALGLTTLIIKIGESASPWHKAVSTSRQPKHWM